MHKRKKSDAVVFTDLYATWRDVNKVLVGSIARRVFVQSRGTGTIADQRDLDSLKGVFLKAASDQFGGGQVGSAAHSRRGIVHGFSYTNGCIMQSAVRTLICRNEIPTSK